MKRPSTSQAPSALAAEDFEKYRGKWIALGRNGNRVVASADNLDGLEDEIVAAGLDPGNVVIDRIEDDDVIVGGAGLA